MYVRSHTHMYIQYTYRIWVHYYILGACSLNLGQYFFLPLMSTHLDFYVHVLCLEKLVLNSPSSKTVCYDGKDQYFKKHFKDYK